MNIKNKEIINGDCLEIMKEFSDKCFDVSFTSPPYNRKRNDTYAKFNDVKDDYFDFLCKVTKELLRCTKGSVIINLQSNMYNKIDVAKWQGEFAEYIKGIVIWTKQNPIPSWNYKKDKDVYSVTNGFEYFFVLGEDTKAFEANNKIFNYIHTNVNNEHFKGHSAVMRRDVAEHFIANFTKENDFVFDPFMGCGTTAVVCTELKRRWAGIELVPEYKEIAETRLKSLDN